MGRELSSSLVESTASSGLILVLKLVQSSPGFEAEPPGVRGFRSRPGFSCALWLLASFFRLGIYSVKRSELRTVLDGEFDWGGTSVKR